MSKQIKVIQCPKCGSTQKKELKPDHYQCENCHTEYFLDDDDIHINHTINYSTPPVNPNLSALDITKSRKLIFAILIVFIAVVLFFPFRFFLSGHSKITSVSADQKDEFHWGNEAVTAYLAENQSPVLVIIGGRNYVDDSNANKNANYIAFYDLPSGKELKNQRLTGIEKTGNEHFEIREFDHGDIYVIVNKSTIFKINKSSYFMEDVTSKEFQSQPELISGIANAEFVYKSDGYGFNLLTNDGKNYYYYPILNKIYTKDDRYKASIGMLSLDSGAKDRTAFTFSQYSRDYPDEKIQLIKYVYKYNNGGPEDEARFEWKQIYSPSRGDQKTFINNDLYRLLSYTDFSPGRLYFNPKLLCSDNDNLLISFNHTAAEKSPTSLQCLNAHTGEIVFTTPFAETEYFDEAIRYKNGFVITKTGSALVVDMKGKLIKTFKVNTY